MKVIWTGLEDSGKSYKLAYTAAQIVYRNSNWIQQGCVPRPLLFQEDIWSDKMFDLCTEYGVPFKFWKDLAELPGLTGADMFIDEVGTYFDARTFKDLPLDIRLWLAQASKMGVDIYGAAQDFAQVDISYRRLVGNLFEISKVVGSRRPHETKPPVNSIWGLCTIKEMDPVGYDEAKKAFNQISMIPWPFFIRKEVCDLFNTNIRVRKSLPPPYKHIARRCEVPGCKLELYSFEHGEKHRISHV